MKLYRIIAVALLLLSGGSNKLFAGIRMPAIFGDNMVLQRGIKVPVWGSADAGAQVQIVFNKKVFKTTAGADGKWTLRLDSYAAGGPYTMQVQAGTGQLQFKNILIGDVWVSSGQSNMEFGIQTERHGAEAIAKATDTLIHFFYVPMAFALQPQEDIAKPGSDSPNGKWVVCSPQLMGDPHWAWHGFSAVGYYFALQIRATQHCPVGMIATYKGGTPAQAWVSQPELAAKPAFKKYVGVHDSLLKHFDDNSAAYPQKKADFQAALQLWNTGVGNDFNQAHKQWETLAAQLKASGQPVPPAPKPSRPAPQPLSDPAGGFSSASNLYNAMVAPIVPYGIKGVIWYQGESNGDRLADALEYKTLFPRLITDWRTNWGQAHLPFLFVQLTNYRTPAKVPSEGNWPWVREAQLMTLSLPETGMAVITDTGEADNIHPLNKEDVGLRLALAARHVAYGEQLVYSGPVYKSMDAEAGRIRIKFDQVGSGLAIDSIRHPGMTVLNGFGIAGDDGRFVWANAILQGNSVVVWSDEVAKPAAVRYNWADNPPGNLYNKEGLPASPFRTDDWAAVAAVK